MMAIEKLKAFGYSFAVTGDGRIEYSYKGTPPPPPETQALLAEVKAQKETAVAYLNVVWPPESLEAERKFRIGAPRLYPFIGKTVRTPLGYGKLWQVGCDLVRVRLLNNPNKLASFQWVEVWPVN
jgi:hypothetical protein